MKEGTKGTKKGGNIKKKREEHGGRIERGMKEQKIGKKDEI